MLKVQIIILLSVITFYSCNGYEEKYNKENRENTSGVDYSIPVNVKFLMTITHDNFLEMYYTVNVPADTLNVNQVSIVDNWIYKIADSLWKKGFEGASIVVIKETTYTNKLKKDPGITDSMNPFEQNNVYLLQYGFNQQRLSSKVVNRK